MADEDTIKANYPAIDAAFAFVVPSYQIMASRFESADAKLNTMIATLLSLTMAIPVFSKLIDPNISFRSWWFAIGIVMFLAGVGIGLRGRLTGCLTVVDPAKHFNKSLHRGDLDFKKNAICFAGDHMAMNAEAIRVKGVFSVRVAVAIALETMAFLAWIASSA